MNDDDAHLPVADCDCDLCRPIRDEQEVEAIAALIEAKRNELQLMYQCDDTGRLEGKTAAWFEYCRT